jgi:hypothetical protein
MSCRPEACLKEAWVDQVALLMVGRAEARWNIFWGRDETGFDGIGTGSTGTATELGSDSN